MAVMKIRGEDGKFHEVPSMQGTPGTTPVKGQDYFTDADKQEIIDAVVKSVPDELPPIVDVPDDYVLTVSEGAVQWMAQSGGSGGINLDPELKEYYTAAKQNIKTAIENKGVHVLDTDSLNSYAERIGEIPSAVSPTETLPKQTVLSGTGLHDAGGIELVWQDVGASGYLVKRKLGGIPVSTADGDTVCDIQELTFVDTGVEKDLEYYYRIFPYNSKRQFQAELEHSYVKVVYVDRSGQKQIKDLAINDKIKFGVYDGTNLVWEVKDTMTVDKGYVSVACSSDLGSIQFDALENESGNPNPITNRKNYGNNRYLYSNVRQILNSDLEKNLWYVKQHEYDVAPSYAKTKNGFLYEFTQYEKDVIHPISIKCVMDTNDGGGTETMLDKVWLASSYEVGLEFTQPTENDHTFDGFPDQESRKYPSNWWLRTVNNANSENPNTASIVRFVNASGTLNNNYVAYSSCIAVRPFCSLPASTYVRWSDSDGAYIFADDSQRNG